jgi:hypothetical protein
MDKINDCKPKRQSVFTTAGKTISRCQASRQLSELKNAGVFSVGTFSTISPQEELAMRDAFEGRQNEAYIALLLRDENNLRGKKKPTEEEALKISEDELDRLFQTGDGRRRKKKKGKKKKGKKKKDPVKEVYKKFPFLAGIKKEMKKKKHKK